MESPSKNNPCLRYNCSFCCSPVKIHCLKIIDISLPFIERKEILIPVKQESIKLKSYHCSNFNFKTGLCIDYLNRPQMCKNTECLPFKMEGWQKQKKLIEKIKSEEFMKIPY